MKKKNKQEVTSNWNSSIEEKIIERGGKQKKTSSSRALYLKASRTYVLIEQIKNKKNSEFSFSFYDLSWRYISSHFFLLDESSSSAHFSPHNIGFSPNGEYALSIGEYAPTADETRIYYLDLSLSSIVKGQQQNTERKMLVVEGGGKKEGEDKIIFPILDFDGEVSKIRILNDDNFVVKGYYATQKLCNFRSPQDKILLGHISWEMGKPFFFRTVFPVLIMSPSRKWKMAQSIVPNFYFLHEYEDEDCDQIRTVVKLDILDAVEIVKESIQLTDEYLVCMTERQPFPVYKYPHVFVWDLKQISKSAISMLINKEAKTPPTFVLRQDEIIGFNFVNSSQVVITQSSNNDIEFWDLNQTEKVSGGSFMVMSCKKVATFHKKTRTDFVFVERSNSVLYQESSTSNTLRVLHMKSPNSKRVLTLALCASKLLEDHYYHQGGLPSDVIHKIFQFL